MKAGKHQSNRRHSSWALPRRTRHYHVWFFVKDKKGLEQCVSLRRFFFLPLHPSPTKPEKIKYRYRVSLPGLGNLLTSKKPHALFIHLTQRTTPFLVPLLLTRHPPNDLISFCFSFFGRNGHYKFHEIWKLNFRKTSFCYFYTYFSRWGRVMPLT